MGDEDAEESVSSKADRARHAYLRKVLLSGRFMAPAVASLAMSNLGADQAQTGVANQFAFPGCPNQPNCVEQTVAYIEHPQSQYIPYYMFLDFLKVMQEYHNLPPVDGARAIAEQWCSHALPIPITPPPQAGDDEDGHPSAEGA